MKRITILALFVILLSSCDRNIDVNKGNAEVLPLKFKIDFSTRAGSPQPEVNSVRIIAFDGNAVCALNEKTTDLTVTEVSDGYTVTLDNEYTLASSSSSNYDLYAIINEDDYTLEGTESLLSSLLDANVTVGAKNMNLFLSYFNSPVKYSESAVVSGSEPAFIMGAVSSYAMQEGDSKTPASVSFAVMDRSMAQVTVNAITSAPADGIDYVSTEIPKVFVLGVSLENVPSAAAWSLNAGRLKENPTSIAIGEANADGYYDRTWTGTISQNVTVNTIRRQTTDAKYWRTDKDQNTGWSFTTGAPYIFYDNDDSKAFGDKGAKGGIQKINNKYEGQVSTLNTVDLPAVFNNSANISGTSYEVVDLASQGESTPTTGYWNVNIGRSFYIPENIATEIGNETYIKVTLAVSSPSLDLSSMTAADYPVPTSIKEADDDLDFIYCINDYNIADASSKITYNGTANKDKWIKQAFIDNGHVLASNSSGIQGTEVTSANGSKYYLAYVDGFSRRAAGTADVVVDNTTSGVGLNWNVPTSGANVYEFRIPVNNLAFDDDYSVRRNTQYSITLHITNSTSFTRAPGKQGIGIKATVNRQRIESNEK